MDSATKRGEITFFERASGGSRVWRAGVRLGWRGFAAWSAAWPYGLLALATGIAHLLEVHLVDAAARDFARAVTGWDFGVFARAEAPLHEALAALQPPQALAGVTAYYLLVFVAFLATVPGLVAADGDGRLLRRTLLCYPAIYVLALPLFLFFPSVNPYTTLGAPSPFDAIDPRLEDIYYLLTTRDNTFPSLHVAFTAMLVTQLLRTRWTLLKSSALVHGALLVASVVYLRVHYVADVVGGLALAFVAMALVDACLAPRGRLSRVGRALDGAAERWSPRRTQAYLAAEAWVEASTRRAR